MECVRAHAMLHIANKAAEMDTPLFLQFLRIALVVSRSIETVGTTVCRTLPDCRGKLCPPCMDKPIWDGFQKARATMVTYHRLLLVQVKVDPRRKASEFPARNRRQSILNGQW